MHLVCPHCHSPIEIVTASGNEEVLCPSCGSTFRLDTESTASWRMLRGRHLGRFELIELVGVGAFGTVYKARDPQLDRVVAVKVPRAGNLATKEDLDRFLREGRSVARLVHPTIVPVHEVGLADGVPYLVSEFVEGPSLSDVLTSRQLPLRESAELVATLADALQYAHGQGVIHRDVKPSNILFDQAGKPHLMDFGLAKREAGEITMTQDGQVLGTPAYMSPEQARGEAHRVDGRSDVYSLAVIFYRLLTGELPFRGNQRMLLHQVLNDEPRPLRKLNDHIPRDLETICIKAMAKEPSRRCATAGELAADLRRYLADQPIQARPVGAFERGWRWVKRNRTVAALLAALTVVFLGGFAGVTLALIRSEHFRNQSDLRQQDAVGQRKVAETRRKEAEQAQKLAEANFDEAIEAADGFLTKVGKETLLDAPGLMPLRRDLLTSALAFYQRFLDQRKDDARLEPRVAAAYLNVAKIKATLGPAKESQEAGRLAQETYERLAKTHPDDRETRAGLAETLVWRGSYPEVIAIWEDVVKEQPMSVPYSRGLAGAYNAQGNEQEKKGQYTDALASHQKSLAIYEALARERPDDPETLHGVSCPYNNIGVILDRLGRQEEALVQLQRAVEASRKAVRMQPTSYQYRRSLGLILANVASGLHYLARNDEAVKAYAESILVRRGLARDFAFFPTVHGNLYQSYRALAYHYRIMGKAAEASRTFRTARDLFTNLSGVTAEDLFLQAQVLALCAASDREEARKAKAPAEARESDAEAEQNAQQSIANLKRAVALGFTDPTRLRSSTEFEAVRDRADFQALYTDLVARQSASAQPADLIATKGAVEFSRVGLTKNASDRDRATLAANLHAAGVIAGETGKTGKALSLLRQAREIREALVQKNPNDEAGLTSLAQSHKSLGDLLVKNFTGKWYQTDTLVAARRSYERAVELRSRLFALEPKSNEYQVELGRTEQALGEIYAKAAVLQEGADYLTSATLHSPLIAAHQAAAFFQLALGNDLTYREICERWLKYLPPSDDRALSDTVFTCCFGPNGPDPGARKERVESYHRSKNDPNDSNDLSGYATWLSLVRTGKWDEARAWPNHWHPWWFDTGPQSNALMSVIAYHLGNRENARRFKQKSDEFWLSNMSLTLNSDALTLVESRWFLIWVEWQCQRREMNEVLGDRLNLEETILSLIQARGYAALGLQEKARKTLASIHLPENIAWMWVVRAQIHGRVGMIEKAEADFHHALKLAPQDPATWLALARHHLDQHNWTRSQSAYRRHFALNPSPLADDWLDYAHACWQAGDRGGYLGLCARLEKDSHSFTDPRASTHFGHMLIWNQNPGPEQDWLYRNSRKLAESSPQLLWPSFLWGLYEFRRGRYETAIAAANKPAWTDPNWESMELPWLVKAIAHERLGRHDEARHWLDQAVYSIDDHLASLPAGVRPAMMVFSEFDWRDYQILRREAEALILYDPIFPVDPFAH